MDFNVLCAVCLVLVEALSFTKAPKVFRANVILSIKFFHEDLYKLGLYFMAQMCDQVSTQLILLFTTSVTKLNMFLSV